MKLSDILLLALFFVMGSMIFVIKKMQDVDEPAKIAVPVPALKPHVKSLPAPLQTAKRPKLRLQMSTPEKAGSYGRLSLDEFLAKGSPSIGIRQMVPQNTVEQSLPVESVIKRPRKTPPKHQGNQASLQTEPSIQLSNFEFNTAKPTHPLALAPIDDVRFMDHITEIAEASPVQPDSRSCGTLKHSLKTTPKHAKVRSVGMERQLTKRTSIGVEYVYKDGCYKNDIAPFKSQNMPGDDGVNLRVNMRF